jgi:hypothetical protein
MTYLSTSRSDNVSGVHHWLPVWRLIESVSRIFTADERCSSLNGGLGCLRGGLPIAVEPPQYLIPFVFTELLNEYLGDFVRQFHDEHDMGSDFEPFDHDTLLFGFRPGLLRGLIALRSRSDKPPQTPKRSSAPCSLHS